MAHSSSGVCSFRTSTSTTPQQDAAAMTVTAWFPPSPFRPHSPAPEPFTDVCEGKVEEGKVDDPCIYLVFDGKPVTSIPFGRQATNIRMTKGSVLAEIYQRWQRAAVAVDEAGEDVHGDIAENKRAAYEHYFNSCIEAVKAQMEADSIPAMIADAQEEEEEAEQAVEDSNNDAAP